MSSVHASVRYQPFAQSSCSTKDIRHIYNNMFTIMQVIQQAVSDGPLETVANV